MAVSLPRSTPVINSLRSRVIDAFPGRSSSRALRIWRMSTLPFWFGSDVPPPLLPTRKADRLDLESEGPAATWLAISLASMTLRFWVSWAVSSTLRGAAIGASFAFLWSLLGAIGLISAPSIMLIAVFAGIGSIPGLAFGLLNRPTPQRVAMMIDRTFDLDERLITAIDKEAQVHPEFVTMQRADAANALATILREIRIVHMLPVRECVLLMVAVTSALAVWMFAFDSQQVDALTDTRVPGYYPASERLADDQGALPRNPTPQTESGNDTSPATSGETSDANQDLQDLGELGKALDQHDTTKAAANAIAGGDLTGAASALDTAAPDIANASREDREALANDLDEAANAISAENPELAQQTRDTADAIRKGGPEAEKSVSDLADEIEKQAPPEAQESATGEGEPGSSNSAPVGEQQPGSGDQSSSNGESPGDPAEGSSSDPGAGADAAPGVAGEPAAEEPATAEGEQPGGSEGTEGSGSATDPGASGAAGDPAETGESPENGQSNQDDASGGDTSTSSLGNPQDESSDSQGSGAGSGQQDANDQPVEGKPPTSAEPNPGGSAESDPAEVETGDPPSAPVGETGEGGTAGSGNDTIQIGGRSGDTVQSGNDVGSSSLGSGSSGADVSGGDAESQPVGPAGPDSNRVPDDYEDVVNDYFSEPEP